MTYASHTPTYHDPSILKPIPSPDTDADGDSAVGQFKTSTKNRDSDKQVYSMGPSAGDKLAMTGLFAHGSDSLLKLWVDGDMSIGPGFGRMDHGRSHFLVKDAAAKGVSVSQEKYGGGERGQCESGKVFEDVYYDIS